MESATPPDPKPPDISKAVSPGPNGSEIDTLKTSMTTLGKHSKDPVVDHSSNLTPGHQGDDNTGGIDKNQLVLCCSNVDLSLDYEGLYLIMKGFGEVQRMKLIISSDANSFTLYTTFTSSVSAYNASKHLNGHSVNDRNLKTKLYSYDNIRDDAFDFIPKQFEST